jgi:hypothetical protein
MVVLGDNVLPCHAIHSIELSGKQARYYLGVVARGGTVIETLGRSRLLHDGDVWSGAAVQGTGQVTTARVAFCHPGRRPPCSSVVAVLAQLLRPALDCATTNSVMLRPGRRRPSCRSPPHATDGMRVRTCWAGSVCPRRPCRKSEPVVGQGERARAQGRSSLHQDPSGDLALARGRARRGVRLSSAEVTEPSRTLCHALVDVTWLAHAARSRVGTREGEVCVTTGWAISLCTTGTISRMAQLTHRDTTGWAAPAYQDSRQALPRETYGLARSDVPDLTFVP